MLFERRQCGNFAFGPDEKMQVNSMEAEEKQTTEAPGLGKPLWWKVRKSNISKMDDDHQKIFLLTLFIHRPRPSSEGCWSNRKTGESCQDFSLTNWSDKVKVDSYFFCEKGEEPNSDSDLAAQVQLGVVGLRHDRWHHSRPHRHTSGGFLKHRLDWNHQSQWLQVSSKCII